jgi:branched-chain amino acid transport system ATP-binding protein
MTLLTVKQVYKDFNGLEVLTGVDLDVQKGGRHAVIGPNGAGKTTLFNIISGRFKASGGRLEFKNNNIGSLPPHARNRLGMCRSFQITNVFQNLSVFVNVQAGVRCRHGLRYNLFRRPEHMRVVNRQTEAILEKIGLIDVRDMPAGELSYGQQRALEIGLTLSTNPELILMDEPTAGMTREETEHAVDLIDVATADRTLLIIEHDMNVIFSLADTISVLHHGTILASGTPEAIRNDQRVKDAYLGEEE